MRKITFLFLLLSNIAYCQISVSQEYQIKKGSNLNLPGKNEIIISGYIPEPHDLKYFPKVYGMYDRRILDSLYPVKFYSKEPITFYTTTPMGNPNSNDSTIYIEIFPGEDIQVFYDKVGEYKLSAKNNPSRSNELSFYYKNQLISNNYDFIYPLLKNRSFTSIVKYIDSVEYARMDYLKAFVSNHMLTDRFYPMISQLIQDKKNWTLSALLADNKEMFSEKQQPVIAKLKSFYFKNDVHSSYDYQLGAFEFCVFLTKKELKLPVTPENLYKTANQYFKGRTLDRILYSIMNIALLDYTHSTSRMLVDFYAKCKDSDYIDNIKLKEATINFKNGKAINEGLLTLDKRTTSWMQILEKYKGKVIYVDFWASWCGPCINELPYLEKLKKQYTNKEVAFISISIDEKFTDWKRKADQLKIDSRYSFILKNSGDQSILKNCLEIGSVPHYVLINRTGKFVEKDAIKPSDKAINALIDKYL